MKVATRKQLDAIALKYGMRRKAVINIPLICGWRIVKVEDNDSLRNRILKEIETRV